MRLFLAACVPLLLAAQDAKEIVSRAVETDQRNEEIARNYVYRERDVVTSAAQSGLRRPTRQNIRTYEVMLIDGSPYRRLIARNDMPLTPAEQRREDERRRKADAGRARETAEQRRKRIEAWDQKRRKKREQNRDIPEAFQFTITGQERLNGADVWVIDAAPRPGFRASTMAGRAILPKVHCTFWISQTDYAWVKLDVVAVQPVWFAGVLLRLSKGSRVVVEQTLVNDEVWLPKSIEASIGARALVVAAVESELRTEFSDYKKFQADSRIVGFEERK